MIFFILLINNLFAEVSKDKLREYYLMKNLSNKVKELSQSDELKGVGNIFISNVEITESSTSQEKNSKTEKKYKAFVRNCGKIELPNKDIKNLKNNDRIRIRFESYGNCKVSDWEKF